MPATLIELHPSAEPDALRRAAIASLRANRIEPKFLYVTPRQTELWREVFLRHSPIHHNRAFAELYRETFTKTATQIPLLPEDLLLVGLGCGTGLKERDLYLQLRASGFNACFSAIDVSRDLVLEATQKLETAGARCERGLVSDLLEVEFISDWLDQAGANLRRVITFFGLVPNLAPSAVLHLFDQLLRQSQDVLLASINLAPVDEVTPLTEAMRAILPQYDNPETLAWLSAALEAWELRELVEPPEMSMGEIEGVPAFIATARWKSDAPFQRWGETFSPSTHDPIRLFYSLRYTPELALHLWGHAGFSVEPLGVVPGQEMTIAVRRR